MLRKEIHLNLLSKIIIRCGQLSYAFFLIFIDENFSWGTVLQDLKVYYIFFVYMYAICKDFMEIYVKICSNKRFSLLKN